MVARLTPVIAALLLCSCGGAASGGPAASGPLPTSVPVGRDADHRLPPLSPAVRAARPVAGLRCERREPPRFGVHVELFGRRMSAVLPAGIGVAPPHRGRAPYVRSGRCSYALRTREPTGVVEVAAGPRPASLGDLFALWGQPLSPHRAGPFRGPVRAFLNGRPWRADPRGLPLGRHAQVVVAVGGGVPVHARYAFPPGL
jgi:hypothetical protein